MGKIFNIRNGKRTETIKDCFTGLFIHNSDLEILRLESVSKQISVSQIIRIELRKHILSCPQSAEKMLDTILQTAQENWDCLQSKNKQTKTSFASFKSKVRQELQYHKLTDTQIKYVVSNLKMRNYGAHNKTK